MAQGFYSDQSGTALTTSYQAFVFGFQSKQFMLINDDSTNSIIFSWDGIHQHGLIKHGEDFTLDDMSLDGSNVIYLKSTPSAASYRLTIVG